MSEPTHSPLPWSVDLRGDRIAIIAADGDLVAERIYLEPIDDANFRLIIAAVNNHDELINNHAELLAAAKWAVSGIKGSGTPTIAQLRAAIAKAGELAG